VYNIGGPLPFLTISNAFWTEQDKKARDIENCFRLAFIRGNEFAFKFDVFQGKHFKLEKNKEKS